MFQNDWKYTHVLSYRFTSKSKVLFHYVGILLQRSKSYENDSQMSLRRVIAFDVAKLR
jgi:hypothetical protein